jgi:hypothetical protein
MDFGGMYGNGELDERVPDQPPQGNAFYNPITEGQYCPSGYKAYQVLGTAGVDWPLFWCGRRHVEGRAADYDFGGMYSYASSPDRGAVPWRGDNAYVNPFTFTDSCPPGYRAVRVLGATHLNPNDHSIKKVDNLLFFCYRPHAETGPAMDFAGFSGDGSKPYPNPLTGKYATCLSGYNRYITYGSPYVDYNLFYCGATRNAGKVAAGAGSLGLGEEIVTNTVAHGYSLQAQIDGIISLHPRVFRMWMINNLMFSDISGDGRPTPRVDNMALYHQAVDALTNAGITLIGMDSTFPGWLTGWQSKDHPEKHLPCRDLSSGSPYSAFLDRWKAVWAATALEFPTIRQWEIGNELNAPNRFPPPFDTGSGACKDENGMTKTVFTPQDRLLINLDLMYYGNRGVKSVNPNALVYMPSISPHDAAGNRDRTLASVADFLEQMYTAIAASKKEELPSTNPRDYFDGANWHPYIFPIDATYDSWVAANNRPYQVLQGHGDGGIPVILSEVGYRETTHEYARDGMDHSIDLAQRDLPWLTYLIWFRAYATVHNLHPKNPDDYCDDDCASRYALLLKYPFKRTISAEVFCKYTGCDNPPYKRF